MATHGSILAWRIPQPEEPDQLESMGSQRTEHTLSHTHISHLCRHIKSKKPTEMAF